MFNKYRSDLIQQGLSFLLSSVESPRAAAKLLFDHVFKKGNASEELEKIYFEVLLRHKNGEPVSKIIGSKGFWDLDFITSEDVLDPRPESETLIEAVLDHIDVDEQLTICDVGVGSGCLLLTVLNHRPKCIGIGVDISLKAIDVSKKNSEVLNLVDRCCFINGNLMDSIPDNSIDVFISNPPYIKRKDISSLDNSVKFFDPLFALDGGEDGLDYYRKIFGDLDRVLKKNGVAFLEIGFDQFEQVTSIFNNKFQLLRSYKDLLDFYRVLKFSPQS